MDRKQNPYELLGLEVSASDEEIDSVYKSLKELYFPGVEGMVPEVEIKSERFLEQTKAYKKIKKERKALLKKVNDINKELPVQETPEEFGEMMMTDAYGPNAVFYRKDGNVSADDSKVMSDSAWSGEMGDKFVQYRKGRRANESYDKVMLTDKFATALNSQSNTEVAEVRPEVVKLAENPGIARFMDFSQFDVESLEEDRYYYKNAMANIRAGNFFEAKGMLKKVTEQIPLWSYLMAIITYFEHDYVLARRYSLNAYSSEPENYNYWQLVKFLDPHAEEQHVKEDDLVRIDMSRKSTIRLWAMVIGAIAFAILTAYIIISTGTNMGKLLSPKLTMYTPLMGRYRYYSILWSLAILS